MAFWQGDTDIFGNPIGGGGGGGGMFRGLPTNSQGIFDLPRDPFADPNRPASDAVSVAQQGIPAFEQWTNFLFNDVFPGVPGYGQSYKEFLKLDRPYQQALQNTQNVPTLADVFAVMGLPTRADIEGSYANAFSAVPRTERGAITDQIRGEFDQQLAAWRGGLPNMPTDRWLSAELDRIAQGQAVQGDQSRLQMQQALRASGVAPDDPRFAALTSQAGSNAALAGSAARAQSRAAAEQMANQMALQISGQELGLRGQFLGQVGQGAAQELAQQLGEAGQIGALTASQFNDLLARAALASQAQFAQQGLAHQSQQALQSAAGQAAATYGMGLGALGPATAAYQAATGLPMQIAGMNQAEYLFGLSNIINSILGYGDAVPDFSSIADPINDAVLAMLFRGSGGQQGGGGSFGGGIDFGPLGFNFQS